MNAKTQPPAPQLALIALLDQAFETEIVRVSTVEYNSNSICRKFYEELRKRIAAITQSRPEAELPELPECYGTHCVWDSVRMMKEPGYTADQMRAYGQQCAATRQPNDLAPEWTDGLPPTWWEEWFIASLDNGDRVVLKPLPEEYTYDFTTADGTYFMKSRVRRWMQFPDTEFKTPAEIRDTRPAEVGGDGWLPIESAPEDGTPILIAAMEGGQLFDVLHGRFEVLAQDEEDGPWDIRDGEPWCSYEGRSAGTYFCHWLPEKEWESRWKFGPNTGYTHWRHALSTPGSEAGS